MPFLDGDKPPEREAEGWERWFTTIVLAMFLGLIAAEILRDFKPEKLSAIFIPLFWMPLVALHEAGHAIVARFCGWEVERLVVGYGKLMRRFSIGRTRVELRQFPIEGFVLPFPKNLSSPRIKQTLIYAAGPGIELLLVLAIYLVFGGDVLLSPSSNIGVIALQSLCVSALMGVIINLVPHWTTSGGGKSWSDGMGVLMSHKLPDRYFEEMAKRPSKPDSEA
jgi:hypothetical protein